MPNGKSSLVVAPASLSPDKSVRRGFALAGLMALFAGTAWSAEVRPSAPDQSLVAAVGSQDADQAQPSTARPRMLQQLFTQQDPRIPAFCFVENPTPEQLAAIMQQFNALPPTIANNRDRFFIDSTVWTGPGNQAASGRAVPASLTYSFPPDGVLWGSGTTGPNQLAARFTAMFNANDVDRGRELIRQCFASWRRYTGLTYSEVADDSTPLDNNPVRSSSRGDIRIGAVSDPVNANNGVLAYNFFPNGGADMTLIAEQFSSTALANPNTNYRYLRNVVAHEHGHGLAFIHTVPCNGSKLMEPFINTGYDMVQIDDRRGGQRSYGDRYGGNNSGAAARDWGNLTSPAVRSVIERDLSTNGSAGFDGSSSDWFRFTISSTQNVVISAVPTGGSYANDVQSAQLGGCNGTVTPAPTINAASAGNLNIELRTGVNGATVQSTAAAAAAGSTETLTANNLAAGTYWVRITDVGPNANQTVQLYDLTCRVGTSTAPPVAILGVSKRIAANTNCWFLGNINSYASEAGVAIAGYSYDLDGDGVFDTSLSTASRQYVSNGVYNPTLRVTDSNGLTATDTIQVTVFGASTSVTSVTPSSSVAGVTVPVTINGVNFKGVTSAAAVQVSGTGVTVTGTPVVNVAGTQITGLSFTLTPGAPLGARNITLVNSDGLGLPSSTGTGTALFNVSGVLPSNDACTAPIAFSAGAGTKPFTNVNATNSASSPGPFTNCGGPINNDVWYSWTAPAIGTLTMSSDSASVGFSSRLSAYSTLTCPPTPASLLGCAEFGGQRSFTVTAGQQILFQVGSAVPNVTGSANVFLAFANATGGCCDPATGNCTQTTSTACVSPQTFAGNFTSCLPSNPCPQPLLACCLDSGACSLRTESSCFGINGNPLAGVTSCSPLPCTVPSGACCPGDGSCAITTVAACTGTYQGDNTTCTPTNPCPAVTGACCAADGSCSILTTTGCTTTGGSFQGTSSVCTPNPCPQPTGACCQNSGCSITTAAACTGTSTSFKGVGTTCNASGNNTAPCCKADFNQTGTVTVQDIFDFLSAWFSASPSADFNGANGVSVQDIFDFLASWFQGC